MQNKEISEEAKHRNRREWVKNIIIVFLLIMLLLTFFSNTIMNYSLPEVSVTRISRDKVSKAYSLNLTVEANKKYSVTADETRDIKRVAVKRGQEVKEGQTLFFLEEVKDSREAKQLQEEIDLERTAYEKSLLTVSEDYFTLNQAVSAARDTLNQAIAARDKANNTPSHDHSADRALIEKKARLTADLENIASESYSRLSSESYGKISAEYEAGVKAETEYTAADELCKKYNEEIEKAGAADGIKALERNIEEQKALLEVKKSEFAAETEASSKSMLSSEIAALELKIKYAEEDLEEVKKTIAALETAKEDLGKKEEALSAAQNAFEKKLTELSTGISAEISNIENELGSGQGSEMPAPDPASLDAAVREAQYALDAATNALAKQMESDRVADAQTQLDLDAQLKKIESLEDELEKLVSKQTATEITAPVDGVVEEILFTSGQSFTENDELMTLNISADGFVASASVTPEQAKSVTKGKVAKLKGKNNDKITVTVKSISKDRNDSSKFSITFTVEGDVVDGQALEVELGDSASQFDRVIPRNAVKKDSSGNFVYVVKSKSTPLGNRYIVDKVSVTIQAEDDTQCAVSGDFGDSADWIITASSKPFSAGDQVRMAQE